MLSNPVQQLHLTGEFYLGGSSGTKFRQHTGSFYPTARQWAGPISLGINILNPASSSAGAFTIFTTSVKWFDKLVPHSRNMTHSPFHQTHTKWLLIPLVFHSCKGIHFSTHTTRVLMNRHLRHVLRRHIYVNLDKNNQLDKMG